MQKEPIKMRQERINGAIARPHSASSAGMHPMADAPTAPHAPIREPKRSFPATAHATDAAPLARNITNDSRMSVTDSVNFYAGK
jgi:hypothetical protein